MALVADRQRHCAALGRAHADTNHAEANLIACTVLHSEGGLANVQAGPLELRALNPLGCRGEAHLAVRPHEVSVTAPGDAATTVKGVILFAAYLGSRIEYSIETVIGALFVTCVPQPRPYRAGEEVGLVLTPTKARLVPAG